MGAFRRSGAPFMGRLGIRQERRESGSFLLLMLSCLSRELVVESTIKESFEERRDIKGTKMSSELNSEGTVPLAPSPPAAHLHNNPAFLCRNGGASTLPRHVLPLALPFGFPFLPT